MHDHVAVLNLPSNLENELFNSVNAINNIQENGDYNHLICEYLDSFNYRFSRVSVLDMLTQDIIGNIIQSVTAIMDYPN